MEVKRRATRRQGLRVRFRTMNNTAAVTASATSDMQDQTVSPDEFAKLLHETSERNAVMLSRLAK